MGKYHRDIYQRVYFFIIYLCKCNIILIYYDIGVYIINYYHKILNIFHVIQLYTFFVNLKFSFLINILFI